MGNDNCENIAAALALSCENHKSERKKQSTYLKGFHTLTLSSSLSIFFPFLIKSSEIICASKKLKMTAIKLRATKVID